MMLTKLSPRTRAVFQALFVTVLWSSSWVLIKQTLDDIPPLTFAGLRYTAAFFILLPGIRPHRETIRQLAPRDWGRLAMLGVVFYTLTQGGQFLTLNYLEATTFTLMLNFTAVLVALVGIFTLREIPGWGQWGGIGLFMIGAVLFFYPVQLQAGEALGFLFGGLTVCANAGASLMGRAVNRQATLPPLVVTVISMGIGAFILLGAGLLVQGLPVLSWQNWAVVAWLAAVNTALAFTLWNLSLRTLTAVESSVINNTMLIQIALLAWIFLGETLNGQELMGLVLAGLGGLVVQIAPAITRARQKRMGELRG